MAARTRKIRHDEETRAKIQTSQLINRLHDHVLNDLNLSSTQVSAALGLLKKTLPDLSQQDGTTKHEVGDTLADFMREINGSSRGLPPR